MMVEQYAPDDADADARMLREIEDEKRVIQRILDDLDLEIHEVSFSTSPEVMYTAQALLRSTLTDTVYFQL